MPRGRGFKYGAAAFDMTRTFHGRMSRRVDAVGDAGWDQPGPNVIVECVPLPLTARARPFGDGIAIVVPPIRRVSPEALRLRAETHSYLNLITADLEAKAQDQEARSVLLDAQGHLAEGIGSNIFVVRDGTVLTPHERWVLPGISRETVIRLCIALGIACREDDLDLFDAATADEIFMTSTSLCICPVRGIAGRALPGPFPGPVTRRLSKAYARGVDCDFVAQYLRHLG
jgi:branched-chain amino acid aminotransferase